MKAAQVALCLCAVLLSVTAAALAATPAAGSTTRPSKYTVKYYPFELGYDQAGYVYDNYKIAGGFMKSAKVPYPQGCWNFCLQTMDCQSFSYEKATKKCSLFSYKAYKSGNDKRVKWYSDVKFMSGFRYEGEEEIPAV